MTISDKIKVAIDRVNAAIYEHKPIAVFGLFSGGNDSLPATYVASRSKAFTAVVHINTGIGVEATREFVRETCAVRGWRLLEYKAMENTRPNGEPHPQDYEALCLQFGFPGPDGHRMMYQRLKERQLVRLERDFGASKIGNKRVLYVAGRRSSESARRKRTAKPLELEDRRMWVSPIHDWTAQDCADAREYAGLKKNAVTELIGMSGECLCGAFAKPGELEILRGWPQTHAAWVRITELQKRVRAAGFPWGWGERPPKWFMEKKAGQASLFEPDEESGMELCHNCIKHHGGRN